MLVRSRRFSCFRSSRRWTMSSSIGMPSACWAGKATARRGTARSFRPGMSFVLTGWYWLVGPSVVAGKLLQVLFSVLLVWQTWATARIYLPEGQARLAGWLVALMPTLVFYTATLGYEILIGTDIRPGLSPRVARARAGRRSVAGADPRDWPAPWIRHADQARVPARPGGAGGRLVAAGQSQVWRVVVARRRRRRGDRGHRGAVDRAQPT